MYALGDILQAKVENLLSYIEGVKTYIDYIYNYEARRDYISTYII